jgi:hypothetical protein
MEVYMKVIIFTLQLLYPRGESPWYPMDKKLDEPQNWFGHIDGRGENLSLPEIKLWSGWS